MTAVQTPEGHEDLLAIAERAVRDAVPLFIDGLHSMPPWHMKGDRDPVSDIDLAIEEQVRGFLERETPEIRFVGEESGGSVQNSALSWALDPIDGTVNFLHRLPICAISLGLIDSDSATLGVVSLPLIGPTYTGIVGMGASRDGVPIAPSTPRDLKDCVISLGDYSTGPTAEQRNVQYHNAHRWLASSAYRVRMLGSAAADLVWVADGTLDGTVILSNNPWDTAAGTAIAKAAGGLVVGGAGETHSIHSSATIASGSQTALDAIVKQLSS